MGRKSFDSVIADAETLIRVWGENPKLSLGDLTLADFQATIAAFRTLNSNTEDAKTQLTKLTNDRTDEAARIQGIITRARSGARAQFGPDSSQYEQLGGTRSSDRKPPKRKGGSGSKQA